MKQSPGVAAQGLKQSADARRGAGARWRLFAAAAMACAVVAPAVRAANPPATVAAPAAPARAVAPAPAVPAAPAAAGPAAAPAVNPAAPSAPVFPTAPRVPAAPANPAAPVNPEPMQEVSPAAIAEGHASIAARLETAALSILHEGTPGRNQWTQAAALLESACALDAGNPRYPRLLAEAYRQLGDNTKVIQALSRYRLAARQAAWPVDQVAELELIDRYLATMETDDKRLRYLEDKLEMQTLGAEVRSHIAVLCVPLLAQRSWTDAARMISEAIQLNPLNLEARKLQYQTVATGGTSLQRIEVLLAMLRCNPAQRTVLITLARELSGVGLPSLSASWYRVAFDLSAQTKEPLAKEILLEFATQSYLSGQSAEAGTMVAKVLDAAPQDPDAWFMRLAFDRSELSVQGRYQQELEVAKRAFLSRTVYFARKVLGPPIIAGAGGESTPVVPTEGVNTEALNAVISRVKAHKGDPEMIAGFVASASDWAWFNLYFEEAPDEAVQWINALKALVGANDPRVVRLQGWLDLLRGQIPQAYAELSQIKNTDPLAALGIVRMTARGQIESAPAAPAAPVPAAPAGLPARRPATAPVAAARPFAAPAAARPAAAPATGPVRPPSPARPTTRGAVDAAADARREQDFRAADAMGLRLLEQNHFGLVSVIVWAALRDRNLEPVLPPESRAVRQEVDRFPVQWLQIMKDPGKFYFVTGEPNDILRQLGQPFLATVKVQNKSDFALSVGPDGVISQDLFIDAKIGQAGDWEFRMEAYDRIANVIVLQPHSSSSQQVRVDQGKLDAALIQNPSADAHVYVRVTTNPIAMGSDMVPGPAGLRREFERPFTREQSSMFSNVQKKKVLDGLDGLPSEKLTTIDILAAHIIRARQPDASGRALALAPELANDLRQAERDSIADVAGWATYRLATLEGDPEKAKAAGVLANSPDWEVRLIAGVLAEPLPKALSATVANRLSRDSTDVVAQFGKAMVAELSHPTRRGPATQPTTAPSRAPGA